MTTFDQFLTDLQAAAKLAEDELNTGLRSSWDDQEPTEQGRDEIAEEFNSVWEGR